MRVIYLVAGLGFVAIGGVGVVIPGLPTTVFFIMAAWCFSRSSERLEAWVLGLPGVGQMVSDYRSGLGMPRKAKVTAIACIVIAVSLSAGLMIDNSIVRVVVAVLGVIGVLYVAYRVPTRETILARREAAAAEATGRSAEPR